MDTILSSAILVILAAQVVLLAAGIVVAGYFVVRARLSGEYEPAYDDYAEEKRIREYHEQESERLRESAIHDEIVRRHEQYWQYWSNE